MDYGLEVLEAPLQVALYKMGFLEVEGRYLLRPETNQGLWSRNARLMRERKARLVRDLRFQLPRHHSVGRPTRARPCTTHARTGDNKQPPLIQWRPDVVSVHWVPVNRPWLLECLDKLRGQ